MLQKEVNMAVAYKDLGILGNTVSSILCPFSKDKTHLRIVNQQDSGEHKAVVSKKTPTLAI